MSSVYLPELKDALEWLDDHYGHFLTPILDMGAPEHDYDTPTAYVTLNPKAPDGFSFRINPDFVAVTPTDVLAFALAHETMHVLLGHLRLNSQFPDAQKLNVACDCIINDYLADAGFNVPSEFLRGQKVVGFDCALSNVTDVYYAIPDNSQSSKDESSEKSQSGESGSDSSNASQTGGSSNQPSDGGQEAPDGSNQEESGGEGYGSPCGFSERVAKAAADAAAAGVDVEKFIKDITSKITQAVGDVLPADLSDDLDSAKTSVSSGPGQGFSAAEEIIKGGDFKLKWVELLAEVNPDILKKPGALKEPTKVSYHQPRRKIAAYYPSLVLPVTRTLPQKKSKKGDVKPVVVLALDTSGSIPRSMVAKMTKLARSIPEDLIEVYACTFSTQYVPFDFRHDKNRVASGGTSFSAVENFIQNEVKAKLKKVKGSPDYPSAVVVITDGEAHFGGIKPTDKQLEENWTWLMTGGTSYFKRYVPRAAALSKVHKLSEFL